MKRSTYVSAFVAGAVLLAVSGAAHAASPTQADFDACNKQAQAMASSPAASPGSGGQTGATPGSGSTSGGASTSPSPGSGSSMSTGGSSDAQLQGIASAHAGDAAYKQAYGDCMKGRGF